MVTLLDEVIAKHFQVKFGDFQNFQHFKSEQYISFCKKDSSDQKEVVVTHFPEMRG